MVQLEPSLVLTLKHLGPHGAVITAEQQVSIAARFPAWLQLAERVRRRCSFKVPEDMLVNLQQPSHFFLREQAALDHSLPIKRNEAGLKSLVLWGRLVTLNGKVRGWHMALCSMCDVSMALHLLSGVSESASACMLHEA